MMAMTDDAEWRERTWNRTDDKKTWGAVQVSAGRFYWAAYWFARALYFPADQDAVIAEGFTDNLETAVANAMHAADIALEPPAFPLPPPCSS